MSPGSSPVFAHDFLMETNDSIFCYYAQVDKSGNIIGVGVTGYHGSVISCRDD